MGQQLTEQYRKAVGERTKMTPSIPPFYRVLKCTVCKSSAVRIENIDYQFRFSDLAFHARCPHCQRVTRHMVHDYPDPNPDRIRLKRWDPNRMFIEYNDITGDCEYWLDIEPLVAGKISAGDRFIINTTPWGFIQAVHRKQRYRFNKEYLFHMKESCIAGIPLRGWGMPSILCSFKNFFRLQIMLRYDETLMMDYIVPIRLVSPAGVTGQAGGSNDMMQMANMEKHIRLTLECSHEQLREIKRGVPTRAWCKECQRSYVDSTETPKDKVDPSAPAEEWQICREFPKYRVSSHGRIQRIDRGNYLRPAPNEQGYLCVNVVGVDKVGARKMYRKKAHRLVAKAFCHNPHAHKEVNHEDGVKTNNTAANLKWCTKSENLLHKWRVLGHKHGAYALSRMREANTGHRNHSSKHLFLNGVPMTCKSLSAVCDRSPATVSKMIREGMTPEQIVAAPKFMHRNRSQTKTPSTPGLHLMQSVSANIPENDLDEREKITRSAEIYGTTQEKQIEAIELAAVEEDSALENLAA